MDEKLIIIGTGPAGYTAAIYAARADLSPLVFTGEQLGGQLTTTTEIENFPGFPEGIMGPDLMFNMSQQAEKFGARYAYENVLSVTKEACSDLFVVTTSGGAYKAEAVIIATGATARYLGIEGEKELIGHGLTACATCDGAFYRDVPVCVVGGGDSACEEASFLTRFASKVYLIHRRDQLRASKAMQQRVLSNPKIEPVWNSTIAAYSKDDAGELCAVTLQDTVTGEQRPLEVKCVFMAIGHKPNSKFVGDLVDVDEAGFIKRVNGGTATKTPGLFAAGDVADPVYRQAVSAAGMGCWAAIEAERYLLARE
ncbi:MAG: thioredoxin-disulfide reductase [Akkermansia sp.]|nr:thioredoxin-disulfide reductase [Akkermansia sp.]MBR3943967.1 thioredoxin-disulfide reductase [Akkermansia sp.]MBR7109710.1 thioredoxin-disulfide reductase [Akkermansia sp.]